MPREELLTYDWRFVHLVKCVISERVLKALKGSKSYSKLQELLAEELKVRMEDVATPTSPAGSDIDE